MIRKVHWDITPLSHGGMVTMTTVAKRRRIEHLLIVARS